MFEPFDRTGDRAVDDLQFLQMLQALLDPYAGNIAMRYCGLANIASMLNWYLEDVNWVGFYLMDGDRLVLGPFQGLPGCTTIALSRGVCGLCALTGDVQLVEDVHSFAGHIACDGASNSELVVPIRSAQSGNLVGVIDIDSPSLARFDRQDAAFVEGVSKLVGTLLF